ncbi:MAG: response regulator, partial [Spirosomataceae bacterium]
MLRILLVEDEAPIRDMLKFVLEQSGYETIEAEDYQIALDKIVEPFPDLILLD